MVRTRSIRVPNQALSPSVKHRRYTFSRGRPRIARRFLYWGSKLVADLGSLTIKDEGNPLRTTIQTEVREPLSSPGGEDAGEGEPTYSKSNIEIKNDLSAPLPRRF